MKPTHAVLTGASSGIGLALAEELARDKTNLLLIARRRDLLEEIAQRLRSQFGIRCEVLALDIAQPGAATRAREWCEQNRFPVDCLVNNAGIGVWGPFDETKVAGTTSMLDLNITGLTVMTGEFFPLLRLRPSSVLNVASTAAFQAIPGFASYAATKSYVLSFSRALSHEWEKFGIHVCALCPGPTQTAFMERANMSEFDKLAQMFGASAQSVARAGIKGVKHGQREVVPGFLNWLGSKASQFAPRCLTEWIAGKFFR